MSKRTSRGWWLAAILLVVAAALLGRAVRASRTSAPQAAATISPERVAGATAAAKDLSLAFRHASEVALPGVVSIETRTSGTATGRENPFRGTPWEELFNEQSPRRRPARGGLGSGVIFDSRGYILTNAHVVRGSTRIRVKLHDGREFTADKIGSDAKTDVAVIKIKATGLQPVSLADSDGVAIGQWVLALGQPFGLDSTVTAGIISAKHRGIGIAARENFLQTDAAINPGNSGGPLVNLDGHVVGINTAISTRSGGSNGIGFAIPINLAKWVAEQLIKEGRVERSQLGVAIRTIDAGVAQRLGIENRRGVLVAQVVAGSPAARAGLRAGDVIVALDGRAITTSRELQRDVERSAAGRRRRLTVVRAGQKRTLAVVPRSAE